jgi:hypothetical protein
MRFATRIVILATLVVVQRAAADDVNCSASNTLTPEIRALCKQLSMVGAADGLLLPVTPVSAIYRAARARVMNGDEILARRVAMYEDRWLAIERVRKEANRSIEADVQAARARGIDLSTGSTQVLSSSTLQKVAAYRSVMDLAEEAWNPVSLAPVPPQTPANAASDAAEDSPKSKLEWADDPNGEQAHRTSTEAATKLLTDEDRRNQLRAATSDVYADRATIQRAHLEASVSKDFQSVTPTQNTTPTSSTPNSSPTGTDPGLPTVPSPGPAQQPDPTSQQPGPAPTIPANPSPTNNAGGTACKFDMPPLDQLMNDAAVAEARRRICAAIHQFHVNCPKDYQETDDEMRKMFTGSSVTYTSLEQLACSDPAAAEDPGKAGFANPAEAEMVVNNCTAGGGFGCSEQQATPETICVTIPPNATIVAEHLSTKFLSQGSYEEIGMNHDGNWCKFITRNVKGDGQVCYGFINWSHDQKRQIKVSVQWK